MNFFKRIWKSFFPSVGVDIVEVARSSVGTKDYLKAYEQISWVYSSVKLIAQTIAGVTWRLYDTSKDNWEELSEHEFLDLINKPNKFLSRYELFMLTVSSLELTGEALWYLVRRGNKIIGIFPLNPINLEIEISNGLPKRYLYRVKGQKQVLDENEIVFFKYPNPSNPYRGVSPLRAIAVSADADYYAAQWNRNFFQNAATPAAVLESPVKLPQQEVERLKNMMRQFYSGIDRAHETIILHGGLQFKPIQLSQKDMEFLELRRFTRSEIAAAFGVPLSKLGISEEVNRATAYINDYTFAKNTITPKLIMIRDSLNTFLLKHFGENLYYDFDSVIPEDEEYQTQKYINFVKLGIMTINEVREELGLPEVPWGDTPFNPQMLINYGLKGQEEAKPKSVFKSQFERIAYWKAIVEKKQKVEDNFKGKMVNFFEKQRRQLLEKLKQIKEYNLGKQKITMAEVEKILDELLAFLYADETMQDLNNIYISEQTKNFINSSMDFASDFGLAMFFANENPLLRELMEERTKKFSVYVEDTTYKQLKESLMEGFLAGESETDLAKRVNDVMSLAKRQRAATIARTETFSVVNQAHLETMRMNGIEWKEWLTAGDEKVRENHRAANGQIVRVDEYFIVGGEYLMYPGDPRGSAENVISCRCLNIPAIS